jgi:hypothetical protein
MTSLCASPAPVKVSRSRQPRPRPALVVAFSPFRHSGNVGLLRIALGKLGLDYWVRREPSDYGVVFRLTKFNPHAGDPDESHYHVCLDPEQHGWSCDCKGFTAHGHCKHCHAVLTCLERGELSLCDDAPPPVVDAAPVGDDHFQMLVA